METIFKISADQMVFNYLLRNIALNKHSSLKTKLAAA